MSRKHHAVFEIVHDTHKVAESADHRTSQAELGTKGIRAVTGTHAFRRYNWLAEAATSNSSGNLRGMVVSAKWRTAFRYTSEFGEHLEKLGLVAGFVAAIGEALPRLESIANSAESHALKGMRMTAIAGTAAERALLGIIPEGTHLIYRSLEGWCMVAGLAGGNIGSAAAECVTTLKRADTMVWSAYKTVVSTENQARAIWLLIDVVSALRADEKPGRVPLQ